MFGIWVAINGYSKLKSGIPNYDDEVLQPDLVSGERKIFKRYWYDFFDRLRRTASAAGGAGVSFSIPGTLASGANQAPLFSFQESFAPSALDLLVKQAPVGQSIQARVYAGATIVATAEILAGETSGTAIVSVAIPANAVLTFDLLQVGTTVPGADLTGILR